MYLDKTIGQLVDYLEEEGWLDNSVVVVASDNGGCALDGGSNLPLRGVKASYWEGGIRVNNKELKKKKKNTGLHPIASCRFSFNSSGETRGTPVLTRNQSQKRACRSVFSLKHGMTKLFTLPPSLSLLPPLCGVFNINLAINNSNNAPIDRCLRSCTLPATSRRTSGVVSTRA